MANILRSTYVTRINTMKSYPSGRTPAVSSTDINRAAGVGDGNAANSMTVSSPAGMSSAATTDIDGQNDGATTDVDGSDIRTLLRNKAQEWEKVRRLRFRLEGDVSPAGSEYIKYGYISGEQPGYALGSGIPAAGDSVFEPLDSGEDITLTTLNNILSSMTSIINARTNTEYSYKIRYCHSQCHSQCHGSRGRR